MEDSKNTDTFHHDGGGTELPATRALPLRLADTSDGESISVKDLLLSTTSSTLSSIEAEEDTSAIDHDALVGNAFDSIGSLTDVLKELQSRLRYSITKNNKLLEAYENQVKECDHRRHHAIELKQRLKEATEALATQDVELENLSEQVQALEWLNSDLLSTKEELECRLTDMEQQSASTELLLRDEKIRSQQALKQFAELRDKMATAQATFADEKQCLKRALVALKAEMTSNMQRKQDEFDECRNRSALEISELRGQLAITTEEHNLEKAGLDRELTTFKDQANEEIDKLQKELEEATGKIEFMRTFLIEGRTDASS